MNFETWSGYSGREREAIFVDLLRQLADVEEQQPTRQTFKEISLLKKELKGKISNIIEWESVVD